MRLSCTDNSVEPCCAWALRVNKCNRLPRNGDVPAAGACDAGGWHKDTYTLWKDKSGCSSEMPPFLFTMVVAFYFIYGDVYLSFPNFFVYMAILTGLRLSDQQLTPAPVEEPDTTQDKASRLIRTGGMGLGHRDATA